MVLASGVKQRVLAERGFVVGEGEIDSEEVVAVAFAGTDWESEIEGMEGVPVVGGKVVLETQLESALDYFGCN